MLLLHYKWSWSWWWLPSSLVSLSLPSVPWYPSLVLSVRQPAFAFFRSLSISDFRSRVTFRRERGGGGGEAKQGSRSRSREVESEKDNGNDNDGFRDELHPLFLVQFGTLSFTKVGDCCEFSLVL